MIKRLIILAIASCFFLENIVIHLVLKNNAAYYNITDADETNSSDNEDDLKKDKKEDYKIVSHYKYNFISDILKRSFHSFDEQTYSEYCPQINLPPPDKA